MIATFGRREYNGANIGTRDCCCGHVGGSGSSERRPTVWRGTRLQENLQLMIRSEFEFRRCSLWPAVPDRTQPMALRTASLRRAQFPGRSLPKIVTTRHPFLPSSGAKRAGDSLNQSRYEPTFSASCLGRGRNGQSGWVLVIPSGGHPLMKRYGNSQLVNALVR